MEKSKGDLTDIFRGSAASLAEDSCELLLNDFAGEFPGFFFGSPDKTEGSSSSSLSSVLHQFSPKARSKESAAAAFPKLASAVPIPSPRVPAIKRRKSQARKVLCIPAPTAAGSRPAGGEVVPSDLWAWRKYGQKPIKGSPYPRGYYRCSSSKGCSARKQVERSRTDPNMLVITYTSDHNHPWPTQRNSLAGSTRISHHSSACSSSAVARETKESAAKECELQQLRFPDDFFADLLELDDAPISLLMDEEENNAQVLGAFNMLGWETKRL